MTEAKWLACNDPAKMLPFLRITASDRKLRLFACACCRRVWDLIHDECCRSAVDAAENFADGLLPAWERADRYAAAARVASAWSNCCGEADAAISCAASAMAFAVADEATMREETPAGADGFHIMAEAGHPEHWPGTIALAAGHACGAAAAASAAWAYAFHQDGVEAVLSEAKDWERSVITGGSMRAARLGITAVRGYDDCEELRTAAELSERTAQVRLIHEVFGNPYRPAACLPAWRTEAILSLASAAYEQRCLPAGELDASRLAVLSDALEESGCADATLLSHLRSPGPHIRGCWAVDLVLARE